MYNDNDSNMRNKQMEINTCKILTFSLISRPHAWKMTPFFSISRIRASHWKNTPFSRKGYEHGAHFGRECVCLCLWGGGCSVYIRD